MTLREQFEKESGSVTHFKDGAVVTWNGGYVEWLEKKLAAYEEKEAKQVDGYLHNLFFEPWLKNNEKQK